MARYQVPPDPRDANEKRPRRQRRDNTEPIPWRWLLIGVIVTLVGIVMAFAIANALLARPPLPVSSLEPTIIVLTAPPRPDPTATTAVMTPTPIPTFTPIPTPDVAIAPDEITVGYYAQVVGTGGIGLTIRGGPSTSNVSLMLLSEEEYLLIIGGPEEANDFLWWQVRLDDGTEGWAAGQFLQPAAAP